MPRRPRRSGINYVENDTDRSLTFNKRRGGLFKSASDLSVLTGAKVAVVLESEHGKMFAFGSPSTGNIIDSFLSENALEDPIPAEVQNTNIISLQNELNRLENLKFEQDRRKRVSVASSREIQESSKVAKLIYGEIDDLSVDELNELLHRLVWINQEIEVQLPASQECGHQLDIGGSGPSSWIFSSSLPCQIQVPPSHFPSTSVQPALQITRSSMAIPQSTPLQSSLLNSTMQSSTQAPPMTLLQHNLMPHHPWVAHVSPLPNEEQQCNNESFQVVIDGNPSGHNLPPSSLSSVPPPPPPPPPSPSSAHLPLEDDLFSQELNLNPVLPPQKSNDANTQSILENSDISLLTGSAEENWYPAAGSQFASYQWLSPSLNDLYYGSYGDQDDDDDQDTPGPSFWP